MKAFRRKHPIFVSILVLGLFLLMTEALGYLLQMIPGAENLDLYLVELLLHLPMLLVMILVARLLGLGRIHGPKRSPASLLLPCLPFLVIYSVALVEQLVLLRTPGASLQPPLNIVWFVLCMLMTGLLEELIFRGIITRCLYECFGRTSVGVWISVLLSGLLFGLAHISNAAMPEISLSAALFQVAGAACMGICLGAIYLRTRSFWTVALLHAYMDFCGLAPSGFLGQGNMMESIGNYSAVNLVGALLYLLLGLFLMRPAQVRKLTKPGTVTPTGHVVVLMVTIVLFAGLLTAVSVMSI